MFGAPTQSTPPQLFCETPAIFLLCQKGNIYRTLYLYAGASSREPDHGQESIGHGIFQLNLYKRGTKGDDCGQPLTES